MKEISVSPENPMFSSYDNVLFNKDKTLLITCLKNISGDYIIPNGVTSIKENAFSRCYSLTSVTFSNSVTSIGNQAFSDCSSLKKVAFSNSLINIGEFAFSDCNSLIDITLPNSVTSIGESAFLNCSDVTEITLPNSVESISDNTFAGCSSLTSVKIPDSATNISNTAFSMANTYQKSFKGYFADPDFTDKITAEEIKAGMTVYFKWGDSDESFYAGDFYCQVWYGRITILGYSGKDENVIIPAEIDGLPVTGVSSDTFRNCPQITSITLPDSITDISWNPFSSCENLTELLVSPENPGLSSENGILFNKDKTTLIVYPAGKSAGEYTVPDSVTEIKIQAFYRCEQLTSVTIHKDVTQIDGNPFPHCDNLKEIIVCAENQNFSSLDGVLFNKDQTKIISYPGGSSTEYIIPDSVKTILFQTFFGCTSLTSVIIPDSVIEIDMSAFLRCESLSFVTIGNNVKNIGSQAFWGCSSLESIILPDSVIDIGNGAFEGCYKLKTINIPSTVTSMGKSLFVTRNYDEVVFYGCFSDSEFKNKLAVDSIDYWGNEVYDIKPGTTVYFKRFDTSEYDLSGYGYSSYTIYKYNGSDKEIFIPEEIYGCPVTSIGNGAFSGCANLEKITLPETITSIDAYAFSGCTNLEKITLPQSLTSFGYDGSDSWIPINRPYTVFSECENLKEILVSPENTSFSSIDGVLFNAEKTELIYYPFAKTETQYTIPDSVTSIRGRAFYGITNLKSVTIPESVTKFGGLYGGRGVMALPEYWNPFSMSNIDEQKFLSFYTDISFKNKISLEAMVVNIEGIDQYYSVCDFKGGTTIYFSWSDESDVVTDPNPDDPAPNNPIFDINDYLTNREKRVSYQDFKDDKISRTDYIRLTGDVNEDRSFNLNDIVVAKKMLLNFTGFSSTDLVNMTDGTNSGGLSDIIILKKMFLKMLPVNLIE